MEEKIIQSIVEDITLTPALTKEEESMLRTMMEAGLFYGLSKSKTNPKMKRYLLSTKSGIEIINLVETLKSLESASKVLKEKVKSGGLPLIVGTTPAAKSPVKELGTKFGIPYVAERWLGGTLTNFKTISSRVQYLKNLRAQKESGNLEKYTKKEKLDFERETGRGEKLFSGLEAMEKMPAVVVIFNLKEHELAAREAKRMNVISIAVSSTNADPEMVDYPIVSNDRNPKSIRFISSYFDKAIEEGKKEAEEIAKAAEVQKENG